jgi:hypothetical protein
MNIASARVDHQWPTKWHGNGRKRNQVNGNGWKEQNEKRMRMPMSWLVATLLPLPYY